MMLRKSHSVYDMVSNEIFARARQHTQTHVYCVPERAFENFQHGSSAQQKLAKQKRAALDRSGFLDRHHQCA